MTQGQRNDRIAAIVVSVAALILAAADPAPTALPTNTQNPPTAPVTATSSGSSTPDGGTHSNVSSAGVTNNAPDKLVILFGSGSPVLQDAASATLDKAAHLYRVGNPIVMIVTGSTDATGSPSGNLTLSERRARAVIDGLVARGIPIARLQLLAAGATQPVVKSSDGEPVPDDRRAEITWR